LHHLERQELRRLDRRQARRRHAEPQRVEGDIRQESAPLRHDLVGCLGVGVVVQPPVPSIGRDLGDRVDPAERVRPEPRQVARAGEDRRDPDDRDIRWAGFGLGPARSIDAGDLAVEILRAHLGHFAVELLDGGRRGAECGGLTEHVQPVGLLVRIVDR
jgi:hypothetical protein